MIIKDRKEKIITDDPFDYIKKRCPASLAGQRRPFI